MSDAIPRSPGIPATQPVKHVASGILARCSISDALRLGGGAALVLALVQYLLVGVDARDDLQRFALLLAQTGVFTGGAFLLQRVFADARSARLLIGIALLSVVAGFTVLGAMLYASMPLDGDAFLASTGLLRGAGADSAYPDYAHWEASGAWQLAVAALGALVVLVPTTRFAFAVLARGVAARLTLTTLLASTVLLVPIRDPALLGALTAASWLAVRFAQRGLCARDPALTTVEGRIAQAVPYLPAVVVAVRAMLMYEPGALFALPITLTVWALLRLRSGPLSGPRYALGGTAIIATVLVLVDAMEPLLGAYVMPLSTTVAAIGLADLRRRTDGGRAIRAFDSMAMVLALIPLTIALLVMYLSPDASLLPIVATLPLLGFALHTGRRWTSAAIAICLLWQTVSVAETLLALLSHHGWQSLLIVGLIAVTAAAWLDRMGGLAALFPQLNRDPRDGVAAETNSPDPRDSGPPSPPGIAATTTGMAA